MAGITGVVSATVEVPSIVGDRLGTALGLANTDGDHTRGSEGEARGSGTVKDSNSSAVGELARHPGG